MCLHTGHMHKSHEGHMIVLAGSLAPGQAAVLSRYWSYKKSRGLVFLLKSENLCCKASLWWWQMSAVSRWCFLISAKNTQLTRQQKTPTYCCTRFMIWHFCCCWSPMGVTQVEPSDVHKVRRCEVCMQDSDGHGNNGPHDPTTRLHRPLDNEGST